MPDDPLTELFNYLFHYSGGSKELKAVPQKVLNMLEKCSKIDPKQGSPPHQLGLPTIGTGLFPQAKAIIDPLLHYNYDCMFIKYCICYDTLVSL